MKTHSVTNVGERVFALSVDVAYCVFTCKVRSEPAPTVWVFVIALVRRRSSIPLTNAVNLLQSRQVLNVRFVLVQV